MGKPEAAMGGEPEAAMGKVPHCATETPKRVEIWLRENRQALESSNDYVEKYGLPLTKYRQF